LAAFTEFEITSQQYKEKPFTLNNSALQNINQQR